VSMRRFDSALIGAWLAHRAGLGPEPPGLDAPRLVIQPANRPKLSRACGRATLLRPGEPQVLGFEERPLRLGERMVTTRGLPGFGIRAARWRVFGSGEPVRVVLGVGAGAEASAGRVRLQTMGGYLDRYARTPERGMADRSGTPCRLGTTGPLVVRPTIAHGVRRVGKEAHDVGEFPVDPTRPADYGPTRPDPEGPGVRAFRDACHLIARARREGRPVRVRDSRGRPVPDPVLRRALSTRTAPPALRRAIVAGAAALSGRPALDPATAVGLAARTCARPDCLQPRQGRSPCCGEHRAEAARERSRRYRERKGVAP